MQTSHQVVACAGGDGTVLERRPASRPGRGEMLLRLRVVGLCGTDLFKLRTGSAAAGGVLGHEVVGTVIGLGAGVTEFADGDRIVVPHHVACGVCLLCRQGNETMCEAFKENLMVPGGFSEMILIRQRATALAARRIPDSLSDERAVFLEPAACVLRGVRRSGLGGAGTAVVLGSGSMGLLHLLVLKAVLPGAGVLMVDPNRERLDLARTLGADSATPPGADALEAAHRLTAGLGADAVFDTVGGQSALEAGVELTRPGGTVVLFAHAPAGTSAALDLNALFKSERRLVATYSGALSEQREIFDRLCDGSLDPAPLVTHRLPLDEFERGVSLVEKQQALKVLFTPSDAAVV